MLQLLGVIYLNIDENNIFNDKTHEIYDSNLKVI